jgi:HK97 family phage portal protein
MARRRGTKASGGGIGTVLTNFMRGFAFPNSSGQWGNWPMRLPSSSKFDYNTAVGDLMKSSVVMTTVQWIMRTTPEAPAIVRKRSDGRVVVNHRLPKLLEQPNPFYDGNLLMQATTLDYNVTGNAYWIKARNNMGYPLELWWIPSFMMRPAWPIDGSEYITKYVYQIYNQQYLIDQKDVVHFRFGMDPNNIRLGLSPLAAEIRHIFTDNEAADFSAALIRNFAVPSVVISPAAQGGDEKTVFDDIEDVKNKFIDKFSGSRRGEPMVLDGPTNVEILSFSPEQMNLRDLRKIPEERISAALGVPAMVVGLGAGLDRSTFTNMGEAQDFAYSNNILPTQRLFAAAMTTQLLPDLGNPNTEKVGFDTSEVRALQPDQDAVAKRAVTLYKGDVVKRKVALVMVGEQPEDGADSTDDMYFSEYQAQLKIEAQKQTMQNMIDAGAGPLGGGGPSTPGDNSGNNAPKKPSNGNQPAPGNEGTQTPKKLGDPLVTWASLSGD